MARSKGCLEGLPPTGLGVCACGHTEEEHQFQGHHSNWPCNGDKGNCYCNWYTPEGDPYKEKYLSDERVKQKGGHLSTRAQRENWWNYRHRAGGHDDD